MLYNFKSENQLEVLIPEKNHPIFICGKLSDNGQLFTIDSKKMNGLTARGEYTLTDIEEMKKKISQQSYNEKVRIVFN